MHVRIQLLFYSLYLKNYRPKPVSTAGDGNAFLLHPRVIAAKKNVNEVSLYIRECPATKIRGAVVGLTNKLLSYFEPITLGLNPFLIKGRWRIFPIQLLVVYLFYNCNFYLRHLNLLLFLLSWHMTMSLERRKFRSVLYFL